MSNNNVVNMKGQKIILYLSLIFYFVSLWLISFCTNGRCQNDGLTNLLFGWFTTFMLYPVGIVWLANPILIVSWITLKKNKKVSLILSAVSFLLMLSFLLFNEVVDNEAGVPAIITSIKFGYWLWLLSSLVMLVGNIILYYLNGKWITKREEN